MDCCRFSNGVRPDDLGLSRLRLALTRRGFGWRLGLACLASDPESFPEAAFARRPQPELLAGLQNGVHQIVAEPAAAGDQDGGGRRVVLQDHDLAGDVGERPQEQERGPGGRVRRGRAMVSFSVMRSTSRPSSAMQALPSVVSVQAGPMARRLVVEQPQKRLSHPGAADRSPARMRDPSGSRGQRQPLRRRGRKPAPWMSQRRQVAQVDDPRAGAFVGIVEHDRPAVPALGFLGFAGQVDRRSAFDLAAFIVPYFRNLVQILDAGC